MTKANDLKSMPVRRRGQVTRAALLDAAIVLIPRLGWGAVTTRWVAEHAGVPPGVVHYHFASVEALLVEAATRVSQRLLDEAFTVLASAPDRASGIDQLVTSVVSYQADHPAMLLLTEAALAATRHRDLRDALAHQLAHFRTEVAGWLGRSGYPGDPAVAAATLVAAIDGFVLHRAVDPALSVTAIRAGLARLVFPDA